MAGTSVPEGFTKDLFRLDEKVALVTGGASGLGEAMGCGLAQAGATVVVADVNTEAAESVAQVICDRGGRAECVELDVTKRDKVNAVVADIAQRYGHVDVLVNSAGTAIRHAAEDFPEDAWDRVVTLNLKGSFLACQAVGRQMLSQGKGSIINMASIGASIAYPLTTAYLQSKGGVAQLTRSLALEWAQRGVRVNAIAPGLFNTPLVAANNQTTSTTSEFIMARTPMGRLGEPKEVVGPVIFLASDAASMVTGHVLQVDGGYLIS